MHEYVYNTETQVIHRTVEGRSYESCNLDDMRRRGTREVGGQVGDPSAEEEKERRLSGGYRLCKRCFRATD